jgi:methyl-accepting chemotaxis protein
MKWNSMGVGKKITLGFAVVLVLTAVVGYVGWNGLSRVSDRAETLDDANKIGNLALEWGHNQKDLQITGDKKFMEAADEGMVDFDKMIKEISGDLTGRGDHKGADIVAALDKESDTWMEAFDAYFEKSEANRELVELMEEDGEEFLALLEKGMVKVIDPAKAKAEEAQNVAEMVIWGEIDMVMNEGVIAPFIKLQVHTAMYMLHKSVGQWSELTDAVENLRDGISEWSELVEGNPAMAAVAAEVGKHFSEYEERCTELHSNVLEQQQNISTMQTAAEGMEQKAAELGDSQQAEMNSAQSTATTLSVTLSILAVVIGALAAFVIIKGVTTALKRIINSLSSGAEQVSSASTQVSSASQSLAQGASEQASSLEESSSALEESAGMAKQNADNAQSANQLSIQAREAAEKGQTSMNEMTSAVTDINQSSDQISKIIKVIEEIAFQTNLLALNAAVEAARAGDAGKGFAVVAEEVRNLAKRSADAAKDTNELIGDSVEKAKNGQKIAEESSQALEEIVTNVKKVVDLVGEIAAASQEQAQGIEQINTAVGQMDQVTQQNASNAEESASASEELSAQSQNLQTMVMDLSRIVGGSAADTTSSTNLVATTKPQAAVTPGHTNRISQGFDKLTNHLVKRGQSEETQTPQAIIPMGDKDFKS